MITKPEILKGEVKEFIDAPFDIQMDKKKSVIENSDSFIDHLAEIKSFYSQPFRPEMITEYFEGWRPMMSADHYESEDSFIVIYSLGLKITMGKKLFNNSIRTNESDFNKPKTLSQLITNCIQANIKLTWREKIK